MFSNGGGFEFTLINCVSSFLIAHFTHCWDKKDGLRFMLMPRSARMLAFSSLQLCLSISIVTSGAGKLLIVQSHLSQFVCMHFNNTIFSFNVSARNFYADLYLAVELTRDRIWGMDTGRMFTLRSTKSSASSIASLRYSLVSAGVSCKFCRNLSILPILGLAFALIFSLYILDLSVASSASPD